MAGPLADPEALEPFSDVAAVVSDERGRCVIARRALRAGELVCASEPYAFVPAPAVACHSCCARLQEGAELRCSACTSAWYCGRQCQRTHWSEHKAECTAIAARGKMVTPEGQLLARTLRRRARELAGEKAVTGWGAFDKLASLPSHRSEHDADTLKRYAAVAEEARALLGGADAGADLVELLCIFGCSNFSILDDQLFAVGAGVFPAGALLNHSCEPSCAVMYEGRRQVVRALREVPAGAELTHSYADAALPAGERRARLTERFFFDCRCARCAADPPWPVDRRLVSAEAAAAAPEAVGRARAAAAGARKRAEALRGPSPKAKEGAGAVRAALEAAAGEAAKAGLDPLDPDVWSTRAALFQLCVDVGDWAAAASHCAAVVDAYRALYPPAHPLLGLQLFSLGKVRWNAGATEGAVEALAAAALALGISHGPGAPIVEEAPPLSLLFVSEIASRQVRRLLRDAEREAAS